MSCIMLQDTNVKSNDDECAITIIADLIFIIFFCSSIFNAFRQRKIINTTYDSANCKEIEFLAMYLRF